MELRRQLVDALQTVALALNQPPEINEDLLNPALPRAIIVERHGRRFCHHALPSKYENLRDVSVRYLATLTPQEADLAFWLHGEMLKRLTLRSRYPEVQRAVAIFFNKISIGVLHRHMEERAAKFCSDVLAFAWEEVRRCGIAALLDDAAPRMVFLKNCVGDFACYGLNSRHREVREAGLVLLESLEPHELTEIVQLFLKIVETMFYKGAPMYFLLSPGHPRTCRMDEGQRKRWHELVSTAKVTANDWKRLQLPTDEELIAGGQLSKKLSDEAAAA